MKSLKWLLLAWTYFIEVRFGFGDSPDESLKKAFELGEKATSINYLSQAVAVDPDFAIAWLLLAWTYFIEVRFGFGDSPDESLKKAFELGEKATSINSGIQFTLLKGIMRKL